MFSEDDDSDAVHILPLTPLLVAQLNTVGLLPEDDLDKRIKEHGLHEIADPSQPWKGQIVHAPRPLQVVETEE